MNDEKVPEIVKIGNKNVQVDEQFFKLMELAVEKGLIKLEKRDYRATQVMRMEAPEPPDAFTTFTQIDETKTDERGFPRDLDIKGTTSIFDIYYSCMVESANIFSNLINWQYLKVWDEKERKYKLVEIDLARESVISKKWNNLGLGGEQSWKHIKGLRAFAGLPSEDSPIRKGFRLMGFIKDRGKVKEVMEGNE